jgi:hypothetical protein
MLLTRDTSSMAAANVNLVRSIYAPAREAGSSQVSSRRHSRVCWRAVVHHVRAHADDRPPLWRMWREPKE